MTWVFSGHGAQWRDMGAEMLRYPAFFAALSDIDDIVSAEMGFSAITNLSAGHFDGSDEVQVLTYAMQVGLDAVLRSQGVVPQAIIGHSVGEIAATVAAGCLSPREGATLVCRRAKLYRKVQGLGSMYMISLPFDEVKTELEGRVDVVAAIDSSPSSCVISGESNAVQAFADALTSRGIKTSRVKTDIGFHSPSLECLVEELVQSLDQAIFPKPAKIPLYSTSSKDPRSNGPRDIAYWVNNMVNPVYLTSAIGAALEDGLRTFVEVSSHPIVSHSISETLEERGIEGCNVIPTMIRNRPASKSLLSAIGQLYCAGAPIDVAAFMGTQWDPDVVGTKWAHKPIWRKVDCGSLDATVRHDVEKHTLLGERLAVAGEDLVIFNTKLDESTKPFPGEHPLHGTEIVPAAALINTFYHATQAKSLSHVVLRVPVAISALRQVQVVVKDSEVKITSRLERADDKPEDQSWVTHTTADWYKDAESAAPDIDIETVKQRIGTTLASNFSIDYLDRVGVSAMGFPWQVIEHHGNLQEMIALVDVAPDVEERKFPPWDCHSWAPMLDAATSIGSTIFFDDPKLRMPAQINKVLFHTSSAPPKIGWIRVQKTAGKEIAVDVDVLDTKGEVLVQFVAMRFSEIEGTPGTSGSVESLAHQLAWVPAKYSEEPLRLDRVVVIGENRHDYTAQISSKGYDVSWFSTCDEFHKSWAGAEAVSRPTAIIYVPKRIAAIEKVSRAALQAAEELVSIVKEVHKVSPSNKVFVITENMFEASSATALSQSPLRGLSRIIASELPDLWGGMIDVEEPDFPLNIMRYVKGQDIIRVMDGIPRVSRLRPLPRDRMHDKEGQTTALPKPDGTYVITGGLGALGLEVAQFLVAKGARRLVLLSRRALPPRSEWQRAPKELLPALEQVKSLEAMGATVYSLPLDISAETAATDLQRHLSDLQLPPVLGVVHAAGVLENELILEITPEAFGRVLKPKMTGALALHRTFPPKSLDFFVLFSSCGQLFGFPGQGSYGSANAFLDGLATHRRGLGDNAISFLWTSWRGAGMASSTEFISAELESKGITDISAEDAFRAWEHTAKFDIDHGVVLRSSVFDHDEELPTDLLADIAIRRSVKNDAVVKRSGDDSAVNDIPKDGPELDQYLERKIRECVADVLMLGGIDEVEPHAALSDFGLDSVMTVGLRKKLQSALKIKVPPTLTWSHPTCKHLVGWFKEKVQSN